jgi:hypothetical protein
MIRATWDDCPHLTDEAKAALLASLPPHQRDARSKGIPALGSGAIYPVPESEITIAPFQIPDWYQICAGMDVGWNWTAAVWIARNPDTGMAYIIDAYKAGQREPAIHAEAIRARGDWIPIAIDPASRGRGQADGTQLFETYCDLGLDLVKAVNAREDGIYRVWQKLSTGNLKVFSTCTTWFSEYRIYRRDEKGQIVKKDDHCLHPDTLLYVEIEGIRKSVRVEDIAGASGFVQTVGGYWTQFASCRKTGINQPIVELTFSTGAKVKCTPDHKILTLNGWKQAIDVSGSIVYNTITTSIQRGALWTRILRSYPTQFKSFMGLDITSAESIFNEMGCDFTEKSGKSKTALSLQRIISTISTRINPIIDSAISNWFSDQIILNITKQGILEVSQKKLLKLRSYGIKAMPDQCGINSITSTSKIDFIEKLLRAVFGAEKHLKIHHRQNFAPALASQQPEDLAESIISRDIVVCALKYLLQIGIPAKKLAESLAVDYCEQVIENNPSDVYCMDIPVFHAFSTSDGIVVHNCMDATRYGVVTGLDYAVAKIYQSDVRFKAPRQSANSVTGY